MPYGSRIIKKQIEKRRQGNQNKETVATPLIKKIMAASPQPHKKESKTSEALEKFKHFVTSPTGIVIIIALAILSHYAWKGLKADGAKTK